MEEIDYENFINNKIDEIYGIVIEEESCYGNLNIKYISIVYCIYGVCILLIGVFKQIYIYLYYIYIYLLYISFLEKNSII